MVDAALFFDLDGPGEGTDVLLEDDSEADDMSNAILLGRPDTVLRGEVVDIVPAVEGTSAEWLTLRRRADFVIDGWNARFPVDEGRLATPMTLLTRLRCLLCLPFAGDDEVGSCDEVSAMLESSNSFTFLDRPRFFCDFICSPLSTR